MIKRIYRTIFSLKIRMIISKVRVAIILFLYDLLPKQYLKPMNFWKNRHRNDANWVNGYKNSKNASYRKFFISEIDETYSFASYLELGCNCGPNLELILEKVPNAKYLGIDINDFAISEGKRIFKFNENVDFVCSDFNEGLINIPDKNFDIVFSIYSLAYLPPDQLDLLISQLIRISKKKIIIMEPMELDNIDSKLIYTMPEWKHNYLRYFNDISKFDIKIDHVNEGRMNCMATISFK
jgi:hypothetical protein